MYAVKFSGEFPVNREDTGNGSDTNDDINNRIYLLFLVNMFYFK